MGIIDKEAAMRLATETDSSGTSGEGTALLDSFIDLEKDKKKMDEFIKVFQDFLIKIGEIYGKQGANIQRLQDNYLTGVAETIRSRLLESLDLVKMKGETGINELNTAMRRSASDWETLFAMVGKMTGTELVALSLKMNEKIKELHDAKKISDEVYNLLAKDWAPKKAQEVEGPFKELGRTMGTLIKSMGDGVEMTKKDWEDLGDAVGKCSSIVSQSLSGISKLGAAFGMDKESQATFDQISGMVSGMGNLAKGLASGDASSIISGGVGMIKSAAKLFDFKTKKADKEIKKHAKNLKELQKLYDQLGREADKALGTEEYQKQLEQAKNLETQKAEVEAQMEAEKSKRKKKRDKGKIEEYEKQIKNLEKQAEDVKQNIVDEMMTTDLKSFASQLASSIVTAFAAGTQDFDGIMQGKIDDLIKNMLIKQVSMNVIQKSLQGVFKMAEDFTDETSDGGVSFSADEIRQLKEALEDSKNSIKDRFSGWGKAMEDLELVVDQGLSDRVKGVTGQLEAAMTEGTASELVGLWTMTAMDIRVIREWLLTGTDVSLPQPGFDLSELLEQQYRIEQNTRMTVYQLQDGFGRMGQQLDAIERNTRGYYGRGR